jgi:FtsZ-binding cell division protein ZapB
MTTEQIELLRLFETRVHQLMLLCDELKKENNELKKQQEDLNESYKTLLKENENLKNEYDNLKMARIITVRQDDFGFAKSRLMQLVREVDKCIQLINALS